MVLVVDDEPGIADKITEILKRSGYAAITAYDGEDALEIALLIPPDLVITDVGLPGISGVEVARTLKTKLPDCKILLLSSAEDEGKLPATAAEAGQAFDLADKPFHSSALLALVSVSLKSN